MIFTLDRMPETLGLHPVTTGQRDFKMKSPISISCKVEENPILQASHRETVECLHQDLTYPSTLSIQRERLLYMVVHHLTEVHL